MKKLIYSLCLHLLSASVLLSCSSGGDGNDPLPQTPQLLSSIPAQGATNIPSGDLSIELTFDQNVTSPTAGHSKITLNSATIESVKANLTKVTILAKDLKKSTTYTLNIPAGVILGPAKVEVPELTVSFTTAEPLTLTKTLCTPNPSAQAK